MRLRLSIATLLVGAAAALLHADPESLTRVRSLYQDGEYAAAAEEHRQRLGPRRSRRDEHRLVAGMLDRSQGDLHESVYLNFNADDGTRLLRAGAQANVARLRQIKSRYDGGNLFRVNPNVEPATEPTVGS